MTSAPARPRHPNLPRSKRGAASLESATLLFGLALAAAGGTATLGGTLAAHISSVSSVANRGASLADATAVSTQAGLSAGLRRVAETVRGLVLPRDTDGALRGARTTHHRSASGVRLHVNAPADATGAALPTVFVVPGFAGFARQFRSIPEALVDAGHAVVLLDLPNPWTLRLSRRVALVEEALAMVDALPPSVDRAAFDLLGHSLGGATTLVVGAGDARVRRVVALAPGYVPSPSLAWAALRRGELPTRHRLVEAAAHAPSSKRLIVGAQLDRLVPARAFARKVAGACGASAPCDYVELPRATHARFLDKPVLRVPVWRPRAGSLTHVEWLPLHALVTRARTSASQRAATASLTVGFLSN